MPKRKSGLLELAVLGCVAVASIVSVVIATMTALARAQQRELEEREQDYIAKWFDHRQSRRERQGITYDEVRRAIKSRLLVPSDCSACGNVNTTDDPTAPHHPDMEYRLENALRVYWLCRKCHQNWHFNHNERRKILARKRREPWWYRDENGTPLFPFNPRSQQWSRRSLKWWKNWKYACSDSTPWGERAIQDPGQESVKGTCDRCQMNPRVLWNLPDGSRICRKCRIETCAN